ncbi:MAG: hypothetical protein AAB501_01215 [Patescibacteria group bacterium]
MVKKKIIYIFLGIAIILIAIIFWHKNSLTKNISETPLITEPISKTSKPIIIRSEPQKEKEVLCVKEQRGADFCTQVYAPVCAEVNIQCIKAPCNPVKETFSSSCEACKNQLVSSYTTGECK